MGKDKGLAGKNGVSLLNVYLAIPFGTLSHQNTRIQGTQVLSTQMLSGNLIAYQAKELRPTDTHHFI